MSNKTLLTLGNPNSGKTTLFNQLTGAKQAVGNWAGVTVEKKTGFAKINQLSCNVIDLPGIYSLDNSDSFSQDESIAYNALLNLDYQCILNIVDASTLERSLYLTLQLRELGKPMVVILNKMDLVEKRGVKIDVKKLSTLLGCPVFNLNAKSTNSIFELKIKLSQALSHLEEQKPLAIDYGLEIETLLNQLKTHSKLKNFPRTQHLRWLIGDKNLDNSIADDVKNQVLEKIELLNKQIDVDLAIVDARYSKVTDLCHQCQKQVKSLAIKITDAIDSVVLNKYLGIPVFFAVMYLMFMFAINIGSAFIDFFDISVGAILVDGSHYLFDDHLPVWLMTVVADGLGSGIQTVATFIPVIACLYLFMSLLESSGYMARAAFVLDKGMQKVGLPGKAFVPLVLGFGCNVPSVMATRTLEKEHERYLAASMAPFMSCGARLPVYALFAAAFFPQNGQTVVFALYLLGIAVAIFTGLLFKKILFPSSSGALVMEIPQYELPRIKDVALKTWNKLKRFIFGAGKTIVIVVTILSVLNSIGTDGSFGNENTDKSVLAKAAQFITPVFSPIGIKEENWQATVGIMTGIFAKEAVVGTLNSLYATQTVDEASEYSLIASLKEAVQTIPDNLTGLNFSDPLGIEVGDLSDTESVAKEQGVEVGIFSNLTANFTAASAFAYLVFVLIYTPCSAALGAYVREFGKGFALFIASWTMMLAVVVSTFCYQLTQLSTTPWTSTFWIWSMLGVLLLSIGAIFFYGVKRNHSFGITPSYNAQAKSRLKEVCNTGGCCS